VRWKSRDLIGSGYVRKGFLQQHTVYSKTVEAYALMGCAKSDRKFYADGAFSRDGTREKYLVLCNVTM